MKLTSLILCCATLCACASSPSTKPDFNALIKSAYQLDDSLITVGDALLQAKTISPDQARRLLSIADQTKQALDTAQAVYAAGNEALAQSQLQTATGQISLAQSCANAANAGLTLDACLTKEATP